MDARGGVRTCTWGPRRPLPFPVWDDFAPLKPRDMSTQPRDNLGTRSDSPSRASQNPRRKAPPHHTHLLIEELPGTHILGVERLGLATKEAVCVLCACVCRGVGWVARTSYTEKKTLTRLYFTCHTPCARRLAPSRSPGSASVKSGLHGGGTAASACAFT